MTYTYGRCPQICTLTYINLLARIFEQLYARKLNAIIAVDDNCNCNLLVDLTVLLKLLLVLVREILNRRGQGLGHLTMDNHMLIN